MNAAIAKLAKYRQLMGIAVAALILTVIFVPFQTASAFTVTIDLPDDDDDTISQSASGEPFEITIDVEAGELISIESIELILDNDESSVKRTVFGDDGVRTSGSSNLVIGNVVEISDSLDDTGYGYGFGLVSDGTTFVPNYSYSFTYSNAFIGGNAGGYANAGVTDFVTGLVGPGTITISGTLRTADLAEGSHTLDVLVDTGANGIGDEDVLVATQLAFDVEEAEDQINVEEEVLAGETEVEIDVPGFEVNGEPATITLNFSVATTTTGNAIITLQTPASFIASKTAAQLAALGLDDDGGDLIIDGDFTVAGVISDIDLSALGLPPGTDITIGLTYDDSGLSDEEEEDMRIFHFDDDTDEWDALTNDDPAVNGGDEVDIDENIVYGTTDDFSLFAPAFSPAAGGGGDDGIGVRRGGGQTVYVGILPESFLADNPLLRVQIHDNALLNASGERLTTVRSGEQVAIMGSFKNNQGQAQNYAFIVQIVDEEGITTDIGWLTGNAASQETVEGSRSWLASDPGTYTLRIFVWDNVDESPIPLSEAAERSFRVTS